MIIVLFFTGGISMLNYGIEAFQAIIQCGNISSAAEHLFISQPALSLRINKLEKELGYNLFHRRRGVRNVELTVEGRQFVPLAERWSRLWHDMHEVHKKMQTTPLKIASLNSVSTTVLPPVCSDFLQLRAHSSIEAEDLASYASYNAVESRQIDFGIIVDQRYSLKAICHPLFTEKMTLVCNIQSSLPTSVDIGQLNPRNDIYIPWFLEYEQWYRLKLGKDIRPRLQIQVMQQLEFFLQQMDTWSIVPATVAVILLKNPNIVSRSLNAEVPERNIKYIIPDEGYIPYHDSFLDCFRHRLKLAEQKGLLHCLL